MKQASEQFPVATVSDYRLPIWAVSKQTPLGVRETKWGAIRIENNDFFDEGFITDDSPSSEDVDLTAKVTIKRGVVSARHRDVLDAIFTCAIERQIVKSSIKGVEIHILYDTKEVLKLLGTKVDYRWIESLLLDMMGTVVSIRQKDGKWPESWPLLSYIGNTQISADRKTYQFQGVLKKVVLSPGATQWMAQDIQIFMNREVMKTLLSLKHQVSRSVARWFLSHSEQQHHKIEDVLKAVGCTGGGRMTYKWISKLKDDSVGFSKLGITIGDTIHSVKKEGVWVQNPLNT